MSIRTFVCDEKEIDLLLIKLDKYQDPDLGLSVFAKFNKTEKKPNLFLVIKSDGLNGGLVIDDKETVLWLIARLMTCYKEMHWKD